MSASPVARQATSSQSIPPRRVLYNDESQLPCDYSSTPGGTLYSTTPGGTRIVYERNVLMQLRNSPLSRTPPKGLLSIPDSVLRNSSEGQTLSPLKKNGITQGIQTLSPLKKNGLNRESPSKESVPDEGMEQFQLEM